MVWFSTRPDIMLLDCANGADIHRVLGSGRSASVFARYGKNGEDKKLTLAPHELRHLQNTELFRLGVADTIISKRFNRRSVAQSYEYDHRSLAEDLANIAIPEEASRILGPSAQETLRLIIGGKIAGPIVSEFRMLQREQGDDLAFEYLAA